MESGIHLTAGTIRLLFKQVSVRDYRCLIVKVKRCLSGTANIGIRILAFYTFFPYVSVNCCRFRSKTMKE
jgi:hypothetical protein